MGRKQDLSNSIIYHIRFIDSKVVVYVGSTCNFPNRKRAHNYRCYDENNTKFNLPIYQYIRANGGMDCFEIVPISFHNLSNKSELLVLEQTEMDKYTTLQNKYKASSGCETKQEYNTQYRTEHREHINERKKQHYVENREQILDQKKQYNIDNKEQIAEKGKVKTTCECGCIIRKKEILRHKRSKKHINKLNNV